MRSYLFAVGCMVMFLASCAPRPTIAHDARAESSDPALAALSTIDGWSVAGTPATYDPTSLFELINGAASVFLEYRFTHLTAGLLHNGSGDTVGVEMYRHADELHAFGIYARENNDCAQAADTPLRSCAGPHSLHLLRGPLYIKIIERTGGSAAQRADIAAALARVLPDGDTLAAPFKPFPADNIVARSHHFFTNGFLGVKTFAPVYCARYKTTSTTGTVFYAPVERTEKADSILLALKSVYDGGSVKEFTAGDRIVIDDPFEGTAEVFIKGTLLAGYSCSADTTGFGLIARTLVENL